MPSKKREQGGFDHFVSLFLIFNQEEDVGIDSCFSKHALMVLMEGVGFSLPWKGKSGKISLLMAGSLKLSRIREGICLLDSLYVL